MKTLMIFLMLISAQSFAGYSYGAGNDRQRLNQKDQDSQSLSGSKNLHSSRKRGQSLFQIKGVVIGKTSKQELKNFGAQPGRSNSYQHQGYDFWYNEVTDSVYSIVLNQRSISTWPESWTQVGFKRNLKYREMLSWLEGSGFLTIRSENRLEATMISNLRVLIIKLEFNEQQQIIGVTLLSTPRVSGNL